MHSKIQNQKALRKNLLARQLSWLERRANNAKVTGSIPLRATFLYYPLGKKCITLSSLCALRNVFHAYFSGVSCQIASVHGFQKFFVLFFFSRGIFHLDARAKRIQEQPHCIQNKHQFEFAAVKQDQILRTIAQKNLKFC